MKITQLTSPEIYYHLTQLSERVMKPAKSDSRKETKAITQALEALKKGSERESAKVEKRHIKYLGDICGQDGRIHPLALSIIKNLQHYRKDAWLFNVKS